MKRYIGVVFSLLFLNTFFVSPSVGAVSIRVQPLQYVDQLQKGEKKKGFVDITNPSDEPIKVTMSVQAFRQINDRGSLAFYNDDQVKSGIIPDLSAFELAPKDTMRLFFLIDGAKLPSGDVFAVLFATATPQTATGPITQPVRVGTLFSIVNGTPGAREAEVMDLATTFFHIGESIEGSYTIRNTADLQKNTGFYPTVRISLAPFGSSTESTGNLVFAGRTRTSQFSTDAGSRFGLYRLSVTHGNSEQKQWIFVASGWGKYVPLALIVIGVAVWLWWRRKRTPTYRFDKKRK